MITKSSAQARRKVTSMAFAALLAIGVASASVASAQPFVSSGTDVPAASTTAVTR